MAQTEAETYSTIKFFLRYGNMLAWVVGLIIAAYGIWGAYSGGSWVCAVAGIAVGWFAYMVMRCLREVLALVADTLMPQ
jgi:glucose dehydrogenase